MKSRSNRRDSFVGLDLSNAAANSGLYIQTGQTEVTVKANWADLKIAGRIRVFRGIPSSTGPVCGTHGTRRNNGWDLA